MMVDTTNAFSIPSATSSSTSSRSCLISASQNSGDMMTTTTTTSRTNFLKTAAATVFWTTALLAPQPPLPALAKDDAAAAALKGTKADPEYEACMSTCIYECTKPKGVEQKSRKECIPECKQTCATSKAQLMIGTPIKK
jgi:hypothetical protein